jgi:predicted NUDIX family NTP pyrophosphohydrolase
MVSANRSAGLLMFRRRGGGVEVFLVHPGGPFFARKDLGVWSIPKGEIEPGEDPLEVANREFREETGQSVEACSRGGPLIGLGSVRQSGGKVVEAWCFEGDWPDGAEFRSNTFTTEWPPRSGRIREFPEVDRGEFFPAATARDKINPAQVAFVDRLVQHLEVGA